MTTLTTKIIGSNNYFSLISLNINGLNYPIKDTGYLNRIQHFAAYKKHTSITKTGTISEEKDRKRFPKQMVPGKKEEFPS